MAKKSKKKLEEENKKRIQDEIAAILLLVFGVFFAVAMHTDFAGALGGIVSSAIKGMFGLGGFVLPYVIVIYSIIIFAKMNRPFKATKLIQIFLIFLSIDIMNAERFLDEFSMEIYGGFTGIKEVFIMGTELDNGGVAGMYLGYLIQLLIGSTGLYLMCLAIIAICMLLTLNTPLSKAWDNAKMKKAERELKKAEKQIEREKKEKEKREAKERQLEIPLNNEYNNNYLVDNINKNDNDPYNKKDSVKTKANKKSIMNILKNDDKYGLKKEDENSVASTIGIVDTTIDNEEDFKQEKITKEDVQKAEQELFFKHAHDGNDSDGLSDYILPPLDILTPPVRKRTTKASETSLQESAKLLEKTLKSFNVEAKVINVTKGSSVTRYEIQPAIGVKVASIVRLADDIALNLRAKSIRIEAPIPGKAAVGIEVENESRDMVRISEVIGSKEFQQHPSKLAFGVGRDISGTPVVADLAKMPHMLIAGATGSGKSVCINTIIASILYRATPEEVKLLLVDPKMVELGNYNGIPHLLIPVVTDCAKAAAALNWAVAEMTERYKKFASNGVRDIKAYNALMEKKGEEQLPKIVIIIDELADLMMVASSQVEDAICRLAQLARAAGMHLIVATQRPSVDVVTGLIKANIPSRIAFMVSSQIDSRTIIDMPGAEKLVGNGDMLYKPQDLDKPLRVQGPFISDDEVHNIINYVKSQVEEAEYNEEVVSHIEKGQVKQGNDEEDELMEEAIETVIRSQQASISMLQRRFRIGYNRAARMIEDMEVRGVVGPADGSRARTVLITEEEWLLGNSQTEDEN